jgi:hypothetical protein
VVAFPVYGQRLKTVVGWCMYNVSGGTLPVWGKKGDPPREVKVKLTNGSRPGLIGEAGVNLLRDASEPLEVWKTEGPTDLLALWGNLPAAQRTEVAVVCNANGAQEKPGWMAEALGGHRVRIVHDADAPGEAGAIRWANEIANHTEDCRQISLPYVIEETHGKDLRDFFQDRHSFADLHELAEEAAPLKPEEIVQPIANCRDETYETPDGTETRIVPLEISEIAARISGQTDDWPRRIGPSLFVDERQEISWFRRQSALFGWLLTYGVINWQKGPDYATKGEVYDELCRSATEYSSIEMHPHEPPLPRCYYACKKAEATDGKTLRRLIDFYRPETTIDAELIKAMIATLFWGGPPGGRPAFMITAAGRGYGKTKLAESVASLAGGYISLSSNEDADHMKARMLDVEAMQRRVALMDNIKSLRLSWAELEALITSESISGKRMYHGETSRPNYFTFMITLNGMALSTDMAQRCVIINLAKAENDGEWLQQLMSFINSNRHKIISDVIQFLRRPPQGGIATYSRWAAWDRDILARLRTADGIGPEGIMSAILGRRQEGDVEAEEIEDFEAHVAEHLLDLHYSVEIDRIRIPNRILAEWYKRWADMRGSQTKVTRKLKQAYREGQLKTLRPDPGHRFGRCFLWDPPEGQGDPQNSLIDRISLQNGGQQEF